MNCAHSHQRPDITKKVWICIDCGADTKPFETGVTGKSIAGFDASVIPEPIIGCSERRLTMEP
jgi:hypothetical protein